MSHIMVSRLRRGVIRAALRKDTMPNADDLNRTVFISDNLPFLQSLDSESVDLVVIDPPFGKKQTFKGRLKPPLTLQERAKEKERMEAWDVYNVSTAYELGVEYPDQSGATALFKDIWRFERVMREDWWRQIHDTPVWWLIESTRRTHGSDIAAYIAFMAQRMIEIRRVLKPAGSVYLHCDHEANAYLRQMMDAVFGADKFRNEITWKRTSAHNDADRFGAVTDTILFYGGGQFNHDAIRVPLDDDYVDSFYRYEDERGKYQVGDLTASGPRSGESGEAWRGISPGNRHWAVPAKKDGYAGWIESEIIPGFTEIESTHARLDALDKAGLIYWPSSKSRGKPRLKRYLVANNGQVPNDIWIDIKGAKGREQTGYPTQKPQELARRMIEASSNPGDIVLDCFAGCAYVPVAAEETGRRWIACDMSPRAFTVVRRQFAKKPELGMTVEGEEGEYDEANPRFEGKGVLKVRGPNQLPDRTDGGDQKALAFAAVPVPEIKFRQTPLENSKVIWQAFVVEWGTDCWYCGVQQPKDQRFLQLDHIEPNKGDGSNDDCWNRALACIACNHDKSDKLNPTETMDKALADGRIQTKAKRDEVAATFASRREWARKRYESLPKAQELAGLSVSLAI